MTSITLPLYLERRLPRLQAQALSFAAGFALLVLSARVAIPLPGTPVAITGQTFGVQLLALLWGSRPAAALFATYAILGTIGLPIFAQGRTRLNPVTAGYLAGMLLAAWTVGKLAERGANRSFPRAFGACLVGSAIVLGGGIAWLSRFVPAESLLEKGLFPFLPGDFLKNTAAAWIASRAARRFEGGSSR